MGPKSAARIHNGDSWASRVKPGGWSPHPPSLSIALISSISKSLLHDTSLAQLPPPSPPPFTPPGLFTTKQFVLFPTFGRIWECKCSNNSCLSSHLPPAGMGMLHTSLSECQMSRGCRLVPPRSLRPASGTFSLGWGCLEGASWVSSPTPECDR